MGKTYIFGHKNPDTDSITSSLVMADFEKKKGNAEAVACRLGNVNKETEYVLNYLGIEAPELIENVEDGANVILVDHNSPKESIDNLDNVNILKVVDHHKIALETSYPLFYRAEAVGCTETIMYKLYKENGFEIDKKVIDHHRIGGFKTLLPLFYMAEPVGCTETVIYNLYKTNNIEIDKTIATLMVSAIISDTLLLKSPTTTDDDRKAVKELAEIAGVNPEIYGLEMLKAGTDLSSFSIDEILHLDAKKIDFKDVKSIVNQVNTADILEVMNLKADLEARMNEIINEENLDLFMLLITDIVNSNSQVIALGKSASLVEKAYGVKLENNTALLKGVVSRKKQVVPVMTENA